MFDNCDLSIVNWLAQYSKETDETYLRGFLGRMLFSGQDALKKAKVISGGEMSRAMLAIKALFIKAKKISTVIFDEVDTGISGEIARKVALKIHDISLTTQVISITHLPQVASLSTHHIKIQKNVIKGRTYTEIKELTLDEKIYEIASMISGGKVTESQLNYAREMVLNKEN